MDRLQCYLVLNSLRLIGPIKVRKMVAATGSVEAIFAEPPSRLAKIEGIGEAAAESLRKWRDTIDPEKELGRVEALGAKVIDQEDEKYPRPLLEIYDPPLVLYYKGSEEAWQRKGIAVVGSRHATYYGIEMTKKLSYQMAFSGFTVISGLARGIDTAAHQGALAAKGRTIAVIGSSLDRLYPKENEVLADKMAESGGAILSEFCLGTAPDRQTFPMRNRIVSGMSSGVLVTEAGKDSGAMITAKMAIDQGRTIYAVPGRIDIPSSKGCHQLIKEGARLVEDIEDIFNDMGYLFDKKELEPEQRAPVNLTDAEKAILQTIGTEEMHIDLIIRKSGLSQADVFSCLLKLEIKKLIRQMPGKYFVAIN